MQLIPAADFTEVVPKSIMTSQSNLKNSAVLKRSRKNSMLKKRLNA